jgi:hypothetical protein
MGIQPDVPIPDALPATLYGHFTRRYTEIGLLLEISFNALANHHFWS